MSRSFNQLLKSKNKTIMTLSIVNILIFSTFLGVSYINQDSLQNINLLYDFSISDSQFYTLQEGYNFSYWQNHNYTELEIKITSIFIFYSDDYKDLNETESIQSLIQSQKTNTYNESIDHQIYIIGVTLAELRPRVFYYKVPKGSNFAYILINVAIIVENYVSIPYQYYGVVKDIDSEKKTTDNDKLEINILSLEFNESAYIDYIEYMSNQTNNIPKFYPYYVNFEINKKSKQIIDYFR